ncbi:MAG: hypothetical protein HETSPECPRED_007872 [Heterodermia speciosa]|uniref:Uncharacterized protein n=1 Tax=Heterodermia speciosa TaxID=116794 RepID=A0A8H3G1K9_9LECA|nr:MAG: hypothetical protein HETSPECPRED_007872 [Heterodermia speciosa]
MSSNRHVKLDFDLFADGIQHTPSREQSEAIMDLFPTAFKLSLSWLFLVVVCKQLPAKPWPVTIAGLPLYLTTDPDAEPMNYGLTARGPKLSVDSTIIRWQTPSMQTFQQLYDLFDSLNANINRIQWIGSCFLALAAEAPYPDWRSRLPFAVNKIRIGYIFGEQAVHEKAVRRKVPAGREIDKEAYSQLRPGLMIASGAISGEDNSDVMTTSGICLQSPSGKKYITVAKHGFPGGVGDEVWHPNRQGQKIAEVSKLFGETDIAMAELANVNYSREPFSAHDAPVNPFRNLLDATELRVGDLIFMDTPYNGHCEGIMAKIDVLRLSPGGRPADATEYVLGTFVYFGNGSDTLFSECCGAVIWNDQHDVLGQFSYQQDGGDEMCYCPSFNGLRLLGYTVADAQMH